MTSRVAREIKNCVLATLITNAKQRVSIEELNKIVAYLLKQRGYKSTSLPLLQALKKREIVSATMRTMSKELFLELRAGGVTLRTAPALARRGSLVDAFEIDGKT